MEKYIGYNNTSSKGFSELSLLCDPKKMKRTDCKQSKDAPSKAVINTDKTYLESFKKSMLNKIELFNPTQKNDTVDILLISMWHQYIFNTVDEDKYYDFVKLLNKDFV